MSEAPSQESVVTLRDELHRIYSLRPSLDTFADEAIRLIVAQPGIAAAAVFTYAQRKGTLNLLTAGGLDAKGVDGLRGSVGRTWDIPLRSIRNRRINVVDDAHENPFVPDAIKAIGPQHLDIASIPFYHDSSAVGVAVLFATEAGAFTDSTLREVSQGLRVCGAAIVELARSASNAVMPAADSTTPEGAQPNLLRGLAALKSELVRLNAALDESERQRASEAAERVTAQSFLKAAQQRAENAERELSELREKQARIPELQKEAQDLERRLQNASELAENAKSRVAELEQSLAEKTRDSDARAAELSELQARRTELERELQRAGELAQRHEKSALELNEKLGQLDAVKAEAERLRSDLEATNTARSESEQRATELEQALAAAEAERTQLADELSASKSELDSSAKERENLFSDALKSWEKLEEIEQQRSSLAGQHAELRAANESNQQRIAELTATRDSLEAERRENAAQVEQLSGQISTLEAQRTQLHDELERIRSDSGQSISELREQLEGSDRDRTQLAQQIAAFTPVEEERDRLAKRIEEIESDANAVRRTNEELQAEIAQLQAQSQQLDADRSSLRAQIESLSAGEQDLIREKNDLLASKDSEIATLSERIAEIEKTRESTAQSLEQQLSAAREEASAALDSAQQELAQAKEEHSRLESELAAVKQDEEARNELLSAAADEQSALTRQIETLTAERLRLATNLEEAQNELRDSEQRASENDDRIRELEESLRALREGDLTELKSSVEVAAKAKAEAEEALESANERHALEVIDLQDQLTLARKERDDLVRSLEEHEKLLQSAEHGLTEIQLDDVLGADDDLALEIDRSGAPDASESDVTQAEESDSPEAAGEIVLLDDAQSVSDAIDQLVEIGHRATSIDPQPESATQLSQTNFSCAAINLAAPTAWPTLRKMRNGAGVPHSPMFAYALAQSAEKGFWLGPVDFILLPVDDTDLHGLLRTMVPDLKRVIAMSHDFDLMECVRSQLSDKHVSTAVVLDGRQALDLVPTIKPQAAVLHMSPSCTDVFRAVAGLRTQEETRDIPILFLLDEEAQQREESFLTAGIRMLSGRGSLVPEELPASIISAVGTLQNAV